MDDLFGPQMVRIRCCNCDVLFDITATLHQRRNDDGKDFWCPNGHQQCFTTTTADRLGRELTRAQAQIAQDSTMKKRLAEEAARLGRQVARLKRVAAKAGGEAK